MENQQEIRCSWVTDSQRLGIFYLLLKAATAS
jgi:hypothetical protein